ncbi:uncharacterized protein [Clytia hemisphaerica]
MMEEEMNFTDLNAQLRLTNYSLIIDNKYFSLIQEKVAAINAVPSVTDELDSKYSFEGENSDDSDSNIHRPIVEDYYSINRVPEARERELLTNYFTILAGLDYNVHQHLLQQNLLNELVDASITMNDVPEELI